MIALMNSSYFIFPIISALLLFFGFKTRHKNYISLALWLSLIAVLFEYHTAGGEILGSYFNYKHATVYSINLLILVICIIYLIFNSVYTVKNNFFRYAASLTAAFSITASLILMANLWVNANFIENRLDNTPLLQVATFSQVDYCNYSYVFYKISRNGEIKYMCPNYFGFIPSTGRLDIAPAYVLKQLPPQLQAKFSRSSIDKAI